MRWLASQPFLVGIVVLAQVAAIALFFRAGGPPVWLGWTALVAGVVAMWHTSLWLRNRKRAGMRTADVVIAGGAALFLVFTTISLIAGFGPVTVRQG
jgi:hypothetical protein